MKKLCKLVAVAGIVCLAIATASAATPDPGAFAWSEEFRGAPLNEDALQLSFADEFDQQSISGESGGGPWLAPVHTPYGEAVFDSPGPGNATYRVSNGIATIRASKDSKGVWHAGSIQTVNSMGKGFGQSLGYFEARIKFPAMQGVWCAFWLKSQNESTDPGLIKAEIDVIEWYGGDPRGHHHSLHLRPNKNTAGLGGIKDHWWKSDYTGMDGLSGQWHAHGVLIDEHFITLYVDRKEVARFPALDEYKVPLYPLISMTMSKKDVAKAVSPVDMEIDYFRAYRLKQTPMPPRLIEQP